ncbi:MAG: NAD(P)H-dependent oxidoreductase subunit E [Gammaproteobacteria bacterium]|nr:NAD(P)H-dependent oxidoreductase subunit E [Gammaproteobacteria bacterium]
MERLMSDRPVIEPYRHHLMLCCGKQCEPEEDRALFQYLKQRIAEEGLESGENAVRANRAGCLGVCEQGPIMVVHPDGVWYYNLNRGNVDQIIEEHFKQGKIVESLAFHIAEK